MLDVVLFQRQIPPNTGNIIRLCANTHCRLHLIGKLGFDWDDKKLRRAGLDYQEWTDVVFWENFGQFSQQLDDISRIFMFTTKARTHYSDCSFQPGDYLLFGPETRGLPDTILEAFPLEQKLRLPMAEQSRSLNLSNSAAIAVYEAWRQQAFSGAAQLAPR